MHAPSYINDVFRYLSWADFDASKKKGVNRPFFTYFLLFTCTVALIVSIALNGWEVEPLDVNPMIGPSAETLIRMGAKDSYLIVNENQVWRLLSSAILHAGLVHYFVNMLALFLIGKAIETTHGMLAAAILFIIPAAGGTILSALFLPEYITVGGKCVKVELLQCSISLPNLNDCIFTTQSLGRNFWIDRGVSERYHDELEASLF